MAMRRLRSLSEAECYARCYGGWEATVHVLRLEADSFRVMSSPSKARRFGAASRSTSTHVTRMQLVEPEAA